MSEFGTLLLLDRILTELLRQDSVIHLINTNVGSLAC